ncbi:uncharacterized protein LOC130759885, partial [Actinidia eriantha]|uniref:uncharacterized protein LOC130759885 n=1 Tax=Actinidia eriantha TaxID=165200 RepID=UPI002584D5A7
FHYIQTQNHLFLSLKSKPSQISPKAGRTSRKGSSLSGKILISTSDEDLKETFTKLRFSREAFTEIEKENFKRCLPGDHLDEHFVIHMEGVNILAINYASPGACPYPRQLKLSANWSYNSRTVLKSSKHAQRTPVFAEQILGCENVDGEALPPPERSFWAKYWMYLIPLGLIVMNAMTQAKNIPEEQASGQPGSQTQQTGAAS